MYLKSLEIQGFKSFPDKTSLTFGKDITAIVGPNGSGKSNLSDAIRWVMGEQSTRALRGGKMEDVIFGGTQKRRQQGFAEVSLVLDNSDHYFHLDESEVMVTRRYYRSGESEYYLNRRAVRLKDVSELFMDTGLGREGYSVIGQGKIDEILSVKSVDRRQIFEEAAGISRFRHRKEEASRKLELTEENLVRIGDKIDELELQVEPLRQQSEKAKKFLIYRDELRALEISLWLEQLEKIRTSSIKAVSDYDNAARQRDEANSSLERLYQESETLAALMRECDIEADRVRFRSSALETDLNERESAVALLKNNIENNLQNAERLKRELAEQEGRTGSIDEQLSARRARLEEIAASFERLDSEITRQEELGRQAGESVGILDRELEALREKAALKSASAGEARELLSALCAAAQELLDRDESARGGLMGAEERLKEAESLKSETEGELAKAREERESLLNIIGGYKLRLDGRQKKAKTAAETLTTLKMEDNALQSRMNMLAEMEKMYEGYSKAVKLVMSEAGRGELPGIHGPVAGLLRVPDRYAVAVEIALGGAMQNIVVENEESAKKAISSLKRRDGGRATFLPLTSIRPNQLNERGVKQEPGFVGVASELVEHDDIYGQIFSSLLGRVVIAQDMDSAIAMARKYHYGFRIVTLDGQVMNPGGSMTGGSVSRSAGILSRANELDRLKAQMEKLKADLAAAAKASEEASRDAAAAVYEMETAQGQLRELDDSILTLTGKLENRESQLTAIAGRRAELKTQIENLAARSAKAEGDMEAARGRIAELEGSAAELRSEADGKSRGQSDLKTRMERISEELAGFRMERAALEAEKAALSKAVSELEVLRRDIEGDRSQREGLISDYESRSEALRGEILAAEKDMEKIRGDKERSAAEIAAVTARKLELERRRNVADKESRDKNQELLSLEREVSVLEQKKLAAQMEEKQILDKLWETYELTSEGAKAQRMVLESLPKAGRRVSELKRLIAELGNINVDAIGEFERVNERYTYFVDQRADVQKSKDELETIINDITGEMKVIFRREFESIRTSFSETFLELFGGGRATLELEDQEDILNCGIEIKVQPPGKALKIISLLSGGEKAFVAIALYFAILKVRPTPFCVLDEIEAALDDNNVVRFAEYMRNLTNKTQFIVITHRRGTMEAADVLYGVTMQEQGISRMLTISLNDVVKELQIG